MIEKERIEAAKGADLVALIRSRGIELKKKGKGYVGLCPFHEDKDPSLSVNPAKNLWQCFGCGIGGDAIRFVELFDKVSFPEAVAKLAGNNPPSPPAKAAERPTAGLTVRQIKLLARVIEFYHQAFREDGRAGEYLAGRGITDNAVYSAHKTGFANGTLLNVLPDDGDVTAALKEIGILNERGNEHFYGCVTFPLYDLAGHPAGIYGRRIEAMGEGPSHLYLPGERRGIFNRQAARLNKEIILTESVIDSVTLIASGTHNTIPCYGTNGLTFDHITLLKQHKPTTITIAFDADDSGRKGAQSAALRLAAEGFQAHTLELPDGEDINSFFISTADAGDRFRELIRRSNPEAVKEEMLREASHEAGEAAAQADSFTPTDCGFTAVIRGRSFEVRGIAKGDNKLKATVKGVCGDGGKKRFHVDTVDFYSARSRAYLAKGLSNLFTVPEDALQPDLERLMEQCEAWQEPETAAAAIPPEMLPADREAALALLHNPDMFTEILADFETLGYTGEEMNKLLCYLAAVSRKLDEPLSVMIQSRSAAGKSFLQDTVLSMLPEGDYIKYTRLTDQALFYKDGKSLSHKILAVEELDGMNGAIYSIRAIQSSKKITIAYTGKDAATGKLCTCENTVEGPLSVFITTTKTDIDGETASRFVFLSIDESREMTERILEKQRRNYTRQGIVARLSANGVKEKHQNASRLLQPLAVINPYADLLTFTSRSLRARRDHVKYQNLILSIAFLFQYQREKITIDHGGKSLECVLATLDDIERANEIAGEVLGRSLDELSPPSRRLLSIIRTMAEIHAKENNIPLKEYRFNRRRVREYSGWSDFQVRTHMTELEELEYLFAAAGKRGKEYVYELIYEGGGEDGRPFLVGLIDMERLRKKVEELESSMS
jgi:DNA primase